MPEVFFSKGFATKTNNQICLLEPLEPRLLLSGVGSTGLTQCLANWPELLPFPFGQSDISDSIDSPAVLSISANGSATVDSVIDTSGDVDVLKIVANVTGQMTLAMSADAASAVDPFLEILDALRQPIGSDDNSGGGLDASITIDVQSGSVYYIRATGVGETTGTYTLSMAMVTPPPTPDPGPLPLPTPAGLPGPDAYTAAAEISGRVVQTQSGPVLVVLGTDADDAVSLSQSDTAITLSADGAGVGSFSPGQAGTFFGVAVFGFAGADTITTTYSLSADLSIVIYAGADNDKVYENSPAAAEAFGQDGDDLLVTVGGGSDTLHGEAGADSFWFDSSDMATDADAAENAAQAVHEIASFTPPVYGTEVSMEIAGQDMVDPDSRIAYTDAYASYPLFSNGPQYDDVVQGQLGDCYFLSGLSALARTDPGLITESITALGDGTYAVRYYRSGSALYYRIDGQLPTGGPGFAKLTPDGSELWVALLEKAFAQFRYGQNSYASLEGGSLSEPFVSITGQSIIGRASSSWTADEIAQQIASSLAAGNAVSAKSFTTVAPIVGNHGYAVHSAENVAGIWYITVYNPWGFDGMSWDTNSSDGLLRLTAEEFKDAFYGFTICLA